MQLLYGVKCQYTGFSSVEEHLTVVVLLLSNGRWFDPSKPELLMNKFYKDIWISYFSIYLYRIEI